MDGLALDSQSLSLALCETSKHNKRSSSHPRHWPVWGSQSSTTSTLIRTRSELVKMICCPEIKIYLELFLNGQTERRSDKLTVIERGGNVSFKYGDWLTFIVFHMRNDRNSCVTKEKIAQEVQTLTTFLISTQLASRCMKWVWALDCCFWEVANLKLERWGDMGLCSCLLVPEVRWIFPLQFGRFFPP